MSTTLAEPPAETATPRVALYANQDKPALKQVRPYCGGQEPLFLAALAFSCGIVAANCLWRAPWIWLGGFCLAALTAIAALRRSPQLAAVLTFAAIVSLGGFYLQARDAAQPAI